MVTDPPYRKNRIQFLESDRIKTLDLPQNGSFQQITKHLESAMKADMIRDVGVFAPLFSRASQRSMLSRPVTSGY